MSFEPDNFCPECDEVEQAAKELKTNRRTLLGGAAVTVGASALGAVGSTVLSVTGVAAQTPEASPAAAGETLTDSEGNPVIMPANYKGAELGPIAPVSDEPASLSIFTAATSGVTDFSAETNVYTQWKQEKTNVSLSFQVASSVETNTVLTTTLASGDYPETLMGFGMSRTQQLVYGTQGVLVPIEDYLQSAPNVQKILQAYPEALSLMTLPDGHIYSMPHVNDCYHCRASTGRIWTYKPWFDELGLEVPQTLDELKTVLQAFTDAGHASPIYTDKDSFEGWIDWIQEGFFYTGVNYLRVKDGALEETLTLPERQESLRYAAELYSAGFFGDENFTRDNEQLKQIAASDPVTAGIVSSYYWGGFLDITDQSPTAVWRDYVALPTCAGPSGFRNSVWDYYGAVGTGKFMVTDKCKDPELAVKFCDTFYELESVVRGYAGVINQDVEWGKAGDTGINGEQGLWHQLISWGELPGTEYWDQRNPDYRSSEFRLGEVVDPAAPTFEQALYEAVRDNWFPYAQPQELQPIPFALNEEQANEVALVQQPIADYVKQTRAEFIRGDRNIDNDWQSYVDELKGLGLDRYLELNNAAYQTAMENVAKLGSKFA